MASRLEEGSAQYEAFMSEVYQTPYSRELGVDRNYMRNLLLEEDNPDNGLPGIGTAEEQFDQVKAHLSKAITHALSNLALSEAAQDKMLDLKLKLKDSSTGFELIDVSSAGLNAIKMQ